MGVGVRGTTEGMSGLHMQAWRQGLGMGSWRVRFGWCESRAECLRGRLLVSMPRAGSIWPGAHMHAMYMHMHAAAGLPARFWSSAERLQAPPILVEGFPKNGGVPRARARRCRHFPL